MKKIIVSIFLISVTLTSFSQNMPEEGSTAIGFNVTGLATVAIGNYGGTALGSQVVPDPLGIFPFTFTVNDLLPQRVLLFKSYFSDDLAGRLSLGINSRSSTTTTSDSTGLFEGFETDETSFSAFSVGLGVGIEKHMSTNSEKVDPYVGADLNFAFLGKMKYNNTSDYVDTFGTVNQEYEVSYPGGMALGLNLLTGFNYFFSDNISIGGEVGLGFNFAKIGGDFESTSTVSTTPDGDPTVTTTITDDGTVKNSVSGVNVNSYGGVNLTVYW